jgi:hypothetical protein
MHIMEQLGVRIITQYVYEFLILASFSQLGCGYTL